MIFSRHSEELTITNFTESGDDDYGDREYQRDEITVEGIVQARNQLRTSHDEGGTELITDISVFLPVGTEIYHAEEDTPRPSLVVRKDTGVEYVVEYVFDEGKDFLRVGCKRRQ